jgi:hypothetical protein
MLPVCIPCSIFIGPLCLGSNFLITSPQAQQVVGALEMDQEVAVGSGPMNYESAVHAREAYKRRVIWVNH